MGGVDDVEPWVTDALGDARVARLGTVDDDGAVRLVPVCFTVVDGWLVSAVDHKPKRTGQLRRLDDMRGTGRATVLVDHYDDDWSQLWWVRVRGRAEVHEDGAERDAAIDALQAQVRAVPRARPAGSVWRRRDGRGQVVASVNVSRPSISPSWTRRRCARSRVRGRTARARPVPGASSTSSEAWPSSRSRSTSSASDAVADAAALVAAVDQQPPEVRLRVVLGDARRASRTRRARRRPRSPASTARPARRRRPRGTARRRTSSRTGATKRSWFGCVRSAITARAGRRRDLDEADVGRPATRPRRPRRVVVRGQAVADVVGPLAVVPHRGAGHALDARSRAPRQAGGRQVARVERRLDAVHADGGEQRGRRRAPTASRGEAAALERRRQRVADGGEPPVGAEPDGDVAGELAVVLDGDLHPVAR